MNVKKLILAAAATIALVSPATAFADPEWGDHDGGGWEHHDHDGRWGREHDDDWRRREWREHEGGGRRWRDDGDERAPRAYYAPRCYWRNEYYQTWWGQYEVRSVQVCR